MEVTNIMSLMMEGNSIGRSTCLNLTLVKNMAAVLWANLRKTLRSECYILSTSVTTTKVRKHIGVAILID